MADIYGQLISAQFEILSANPTGIVGRAYFDSTLNHMKYHDGTTWQTVVDLTQLAALSLSNPMTAEGDLLYGGVAGAVTVLAAGTADQVLITGAVPSWGKIANANIDSAAAISFSKLAAGTFNTVPVFGAAGILESSTITPTELGHLSGASSNLQTQITANTNNISANTTAIAGKADGAATTAALALKADASAVTTALALKADAAATTTALAAKADAAATTTALAAKLDKTGGSVTSLTSTNEIKLTAIATPSAPGAGILSLYAKADDKLYYKNSSDVELPVGAGSGSGSGEKNYITNSSGATAATPWTGVGDLDVVRSTTASELPREFTTATGLKITADANVQSVADYVYYDFSLDDVDLNKKLKIQWSQKLFGAYVAGQLAVVITSQADRTTALYTPQTTAIPAADGVFQTSFDSASLATLSLVIRATTDMAVDTGIVISDVVVGPGVIGQVPAVGEWETCTFTSGFVTNATVNAKRRVDGPMMHYDVTVALTGATNSGDFSLTLPTGDVIDTTSLSGATTYGSILDGVANIYDTGVRSYQGLPCYLTTTTIKVLWASGSNLGAVDNTNPITYTNGDGINVKFSVPLTRLRGAGTVNMGAGAQVEYAYPTGTVDASTATNGSATAYGPEGITMSALTDVRDKYIVWQTPPQNGQQIFIQCSNDSGNSWSDTVFPWVYSTTSTLTQGVRFIQTTANVSLFRVGRYTEGTVAWASNHRIRFVKVNPSSPVGFSTVNSTENGLAKATAGLASIRLSNDAGYGSTNTCILRFSNVISSQGSGLTYSDSATLGTSFTVTENGVYTFGVGHHSNLASNVGLSKNSTQLTTSIALVSAADRLAFTTQEAGRITDITFTGYFVSGDVIRPHSDISVTGQAGYGYMFAQRLS